MAYTSTTTQASAIQTLYKEKLLPYLKERDIMTRFASKQKMERGSGGTVRWNRLLKVAPPSRGNLAETTTTSTPKAITSNYIEATPETTGDAFQFTKHAKLESLVKDEAFREIITQQIVEFREKAILQEIYLYGLHHRVDNDSTYEVSGTADSGSTTTLVDNALTQSDDHWGTDTSNWGYCTITTPYGANADTTSKVTNFVASSDTCTVAFNHAIDTTSKYHLVRGTALAATDTLSITALTRVAAIHEYLKTPKFDGGFYRSIIHPGQHQDLHNDSVYQTIIQYSAPKKLGNYETFRTFGIEHLVSNNLYREDVDGSANATSGVVYGTPIFGPNAFAITKWTDGDEFGIEINIINKPDSGNYYGIQSWISWHTIYALKVLRATAIVSLMTGATDLPVII